ncbi:MAG: MCE family protein [Deltaproteobacteria bacterium]|nr:MCE family protein [Deltaproteobacteria bacterium]
MKVGALVLAAAAGWLFWFFNTSKNQLGGADTIGVYAYFKSAGGLSAKSKVTTSGLDVGQIANIRLLNLDLLPEEKARCRAVEDGAAARAAALKPCLDGYAAPWESGRVALQSCVCSAAAHWRFDTEGVDKLAVELPLLAGVARTVVAIGKDGAVTDCRIEQERPLHTAPGCRRGFYARVDLRVKSSFPLHQDAKVEKSTAGLLGSNLLELTPGDPELALLTDGCELVNVGWQSGMEALFSSVGGLEGDLKSIVGNVNGITTSVNDFLGPDEQGSPPPSFRALVKQLQEQLDLLTADLGKTVRSVNGFIGDNRSNITDAIANLTRFSEELKAIADGTGERGESFNKMIGNVQDVTEQLRGVVSDLRSLIGEAEGEAVLAASQPGGAEQMAEARRQMGGIRETVDKLNRSLEALAQVTNRIAAGEGTVGRLLTDDKIANDLEDAIEGAGNIVSGINRLDTHVKVLAWYNFNTNTAHDGLSVQLQPRPDKYYLVELMDDPRRAPVYRWTTTQTNDPLHGGSATTTTTINEFVASATDEFRLTAMFAKMWGPLTLRVGVVENSGGVGANLNFWDNRIRLRSDLFQFSWIDRWPRWRTYAEFEPIDHVFVIGGVDDVINAFDQRWRYNPTGWDYFAGAGISFTDDDLKSLLTVVPMP